MTVGTGSEGTAAPMSEKPAVEMVTLVIDGKSVSVPKGTNLIEAAKIAGVEIPHYCYHPSLSIAGNCRMCQVQIKGQSKLTIACNTVVNNGMEVLTQESSKDVADAQAATLEFILINHPLDCTVCDQAGHCKLQDYHYEYNARPSRFLEDKEHKVKAQLLGPTVILDGERCIMCTRCVRFCDEVTGTSELGMLNRGDRSVIAVNPERPLANPLSGTVVDLCPVGALTHRNWRFNTRIWFTKQTDTICPGCSTGCNAKVAVRDGKVVQVKGRYNPEVNKEWMCDEGRYGFHRYLPEKRLLTPQLLGRPATFEQVVRASPLPKGTLVFLSPDLTTEDYAAIRRFLDLVVKEYRAVVAVRRRELSSVEAILISPDYAANMRGAQFVGLVQAGELDTLEQDYLAALDSLRAGDVSGILVVGDKGVLPEDQDEGILGAIGRIGASMVIATDSDLPILRAVKGVIPGRSILEKSGLLFNRKWRLQYADRSIDFPTGSNPEWRIFSKWAHLVGGGASDPFLSRLSDHASDREVTLALLQLEERFAGLKIADVKAGGVGFAERTEI